MKTLEYQHPVKEPEEMRVLQKGSSLSYLYNIGKQILLPLKHRLESEITPSFTHCTLF